LLVTVPFTSAFAASGCQKLGSGFTTIWSSPLSKYRTEIFHSDGGNLKVCVIANKKTTVDITLYEYDPNNPDDKIANTTYVSGGLCVTYSVAKYVDGDNKKAEVYVASKNHNIGIDFYD
jgi:hypothetical protein